MLKNVSEFKKNIIGFFTKNSNIVALLMISVAIWDINSTCVFLIGQPEMFEGYEKYKKYI